MSESYDVRENVGQRQVDASGYVPAWIIWKRFDQGEWQAVSYGSSRELCERGIRMLQLAQQVSAGTISERDAILVLSP